MTSMPFTSLNHKSLMESFDGLDDWLMSKGVPPRGTDRIHQLLEIVRAHDPRLLGPVVPMTTEEQRQYMFALAELLEFHQIALWLRDEDPTILGPKLNRALSGSVDPAKETLKNKDGRNIMFEMSLAAEWRRAGLDVEIGEPDIRLTANGQIFLVECKRPFTWTGIRSCLIHAAHQLEQNGASASPGAPKGVIAISLNRVLNAGQRRMFVDSLADRTKVGELVNGELEANRWAHYDTVRFDPSIAVVAFHLNVPAGVKEGLQFALLSSINPYKASVDEEALAVFSQAMSYGLPLPEEKSNGSSQP
jgi:hypothetical protein